MPIALATGAAIWARPASAGEGDGAVVEAASRLRAPPVSVSSPSPPMLRSTSRRVGEEVMAFGLSGFIADMRSRIPSRSGNPRIHRRPVRRAKRPNRSRRSAQADRPTREPTPEYPQNPPPSGLAQHLPTSRRAGQTGGALMGGRDSCLMASTLVAGCVFLGLEPARAGSTQLPADSMNLQQIEQMEKCDATKRH